MSSSTSSSYPHADSHGNLLAGNLSGNGNAAVAGNGTVIVGNLSNVGKGNTFKPSDSMTGGGGTVHVVVQGNSETQLATGSGSLVQPTGNVQLHRPPTDPARRQ